MENTFGSVEKLFPQESPSGAHTELRGSVRTRTDTQDRSDGSHRIFNSFSTLLLGFSTVSFSVECSAVQYQPIVEVR